MKPLTWLGGWAAGFGTLEVWARISERWALRNPNASVWQFELMILAAAAVVGLCAFFFFVGLGAAHENGLPRRAWEKVRALYFRLDWLFNLAGILVALFFIATALGIFLGISLPWINWMLFK